MYVILLLIVFVAILCCTFIRNNTHDISFSLERKKILRINLEKDPKQIYYKSIEITYGMNDINGIVIHRYPNLLIINNNSVKNLVDDYITIVK